MSRTLTRMAHIGTLTVLGLAAFTAAASTAHAGEECYVAYDADTGRKYGVCVRSDPQSLTCLYIIETYVDGAETSRRVELPGPCVV